MLEVYYLAPVNSERESRILAEVVAEGGQLDCREGTNSGLTVCLTYEFAGLEQAESAKVRLRHFGEYVEGPHAYGA